MQLFEQEETGTTLEELPEFPHDVDIPDDISGLPATPGFADGRVRWIRWLAVVAMVGALGVLGALIFVGSETEDALTMDPTMERYGTDNPVIVDEAAVPASVEVGGSLDYLERYGTDNPVIIDEGAVPASVEVAGSLDYLERYGTDNPVIIGATPEVVDSMDLYGTDNPVFVDRTWMDLYGTDNPAFGGG